MAKVRIALAQVNATVGDLAVNAEIIVAWTRRAAGATDREIHDTVLIAAAFCMFNRYVDGLATPVPDDPAQYELSAARLVAHGYRVPR